MLVLQKMIRKFHLFLITNILNFYLQQFDSDDDFVHPVPNVLQKFRRTKYPEEIRIIIQSGKRYKMTGKRTTSTDNVRIKVTFLYAQKNL